MKISPQALPEVLLIEPDVFRDERGFFLETYHAKKYAEQGLAATFVQDNHSRSLRGTLRGLHAQLLQPQGKLVRVIHGEVFDVAVDIRKGSPNFGRWAGAALSSDNFRELYIPPGFAHGFCVLSETAEMEYKCTDFYYPKEEITILWNDPAIGVRWPIAGEPTLSPRDRAGKPLAEFSARLPVFSK